MRDKVYEILSKMPEPHKGRVFPTSSIRAAFETAVEQAKVEDFRFHDLRHSFASQWMMSDGRLESLS